VCVDRTRDIAGAMERYAKYSFDKMIYVIGDQQDTHIAQCFKILSLMNAPFTDKLVEHGRVNGMSTRKGEVRFLEDIFDAALETMMGVMMKNEQKFKEIDDPKFVSDWVGMSAVKIQDLQARRVMNYDFDLRTLSMYRAITCIVP